jgi:hypothetical protein
VPLKSHPFGTFVVPTLRIQGEYSFLPFKVCNTYRSTDTSDMIVQGSNPMTTSSVASGFCQNENCGHANNDSVHHGYRYPDSIRDIRILENIATIRIVRISRICKKCPYHEDGEPDW